MNKKKVTYYFDKRHVSKLKLHNSFEFLLIKNVTLIRNMNFVKYHHVAHWSPIKSIYIRKLQAMAKKESQLRRTPVQPACVWDNNSIVIIIS